MEEEFDMELDQEPISEYQNPDDLLEYDIQGIIVYSRDWTTETMLRQIEQGNIDLNPAFQRRNAWNDEKRSKLIESIIKSYPIPEIVLAERRDKKNSFIVIDGKQRLLTIAGFAAPNNYKYWDRPVAKNVVINKQKCSFTYEEMKQMPDVERAFQNTSLRCTVITNYHNDDVLYDIFYRLNAGSTPLATQELRQVLNKGEYSDFLVAETDKTSALHKVMNLKVADRRLRDVEVLLRLMAFMRYGSEYRGNLKVFLDEKMKLFNQLWVSQEDDIRILSETILDTIQLLQTVFGEYKRVGRKYDTDGYESRFNRAILEVQVYYFSQLLGVTLTADKKTDFVDRFKRLCTEDNEFKSTIEGSTKNLDFYKTRYKKMGEIVNAAFGCSLKSIFE